MFFDIVRAGLWDAEFVLILMGKRCPSGGFERFDCVFGLSWIVEGATRTTSLQLALAFCSSLLASVSSLM